MTCDDTPPFPPSTKQPRECVISPVIPGKHRRLSCERPDGHDGDCGLRGSQRYFNQIFHRWNADGWVTDDEPTSKVPHRAPCPCFDCELERQAKQPPDPINPPHYTDGEVECIDYIRRMLGEEGFKSYCYGTVTKYLWRAGRKGGEPHERCMAKADWYMSWLAGRDPRKGK